jgi:hypothetical protein
MSMIFHFFINREVRPVKDSVSGGNESGEMAATLRCGKLRDRQPFPPRGQSRILEG